MYSFKANFHVEFRSNDIARKYYFSLAQKHFSVLQKYASPGRLLDIGCSAGFFLKVALDCGWEVLGIELSEDSAALAIERYGVPVRIGRVEDIQLQRESFDAITLWDFNVYIFNF
jgi:2-polyprenyl-3-methyl-5-hydroxy-6-metoxy-1,4-benzoquinol methylase